ncbi:DoxX family protein [Natrinema caseinilyticum]|uniref:DoxX family protein n=1 Tax=Natrinema caseinilyticum TaxID=2961570 RepID=UPI0020C3EDDB|nr:DoxX family protein [Natrinema caseinilyticum]
MDDTYTDRVQTIRRSIPGWVLVCLRLLLAALVARPALSKFLTYGSSVAFFDAYGIPAPTVMVVVAGIVEVGAVVLLLVGVKERLAAVSLVPVMLVAIVYVGPDWKNLGVLIGALAVLIVERDPDSLRQFAGQILG